jgi:hypothetical protein
MNATVCLAPGVSFDGRSGSLRDELREAPLALNETGKLLVGAMADHSVSDVAGLVNLAMQLTAAAPESVEQDVRGFVIALNQQFLVNIVERKATSVRFRAAVLALLTGHRAIALCHRARLQTSTLRGTLFGVLQATFWVTMRWTVMTAVVATLLLLGLGVREPFLGAGLGMVVGAGIIAHELGHALVLRQTPAAVFVAGRRLAAPSDSCCLR